VVDECATIRAGFSVIKGSCVNGGDEGFCSALDLQCEGDLWENLLHLAL